MTHLPLLLGGALLALPSLHIDGAPRPYYQSCDGAAVHIPANGEPVEETPTAVCGDGSTSFSHHQRGTCGRHGGVAKWLRAVPGGCS